MRNVVTTTATDDYLLVICNPGRIVSNMDWRRSIIGWVLLCAAAEMLGIALAAGWWLAADSLNPEPRTVLARFAMLELKALAGLVEGLVLGVAQAWWLKARYPALPVTGWAMLTTALAVAGWGIGSSFSIFSASGAATPPPAAALDLPMVAVLAATIGALLGGSFGLVQWIALRQAAARAHWWIIANAAGWALAMPCVYLAASVDGASPVGTALLALAGGAGAGLMLGAITAIALRAMPPRTMRSGEPKRPIRPRRSTAARAALQ